MASDRTPLTTPGSSLFQFAREPWPSFPSGSTEWPMILLAPPSSWPVKWSGWMPRPS